MENIEDLRREEIRILDYVVKICEENNIQYYLDFGTLLGAVRHQGFIPWDDDIDISMPRADYNKFLNICENLKSSEFFIQTFDSDLEYYQSFAKMRSTNTTFVEKDTQYLKFNKGVYIDIFPIETISKLNLWSYIKISMAVILNKMCVFTKNPYAFLPYKAARCIAFLFKPIKAYQYNHIIDRILKNKKEEKYSFILDNGFNFKAIVPSELLEKTMTGCFEGQKYKIPLNYDKYLRHVYGDYMCLPPVEKRVNPHTAVVFSTKIGYKDYGKEIDE